MTKAKTEVLNQQMRSNWSLRKILGKVTAKNHQKAWRPKDNEIEYLKCYKKNKMSNKNSISTTTIFTIKEKLRYL